MPEKLKGVYAPRTTAEDVLRVWSANGTRPNEDLDTALHDLSAVMDDTADTVGVKR